MKKLTIALVEPFFGGSHKSWAEGLAKHSIHDFTFYTLKDRNWKWRMYAGAIELAEKVNKSSKTPDLFLVTDMLCLNTFISLLKRDLRSIPCSIYFHENQLNYPWSSNDKEKQTNRDRHYAFINYRSALAASTIAFNSNFHQSQFLKSLTEFLHPFPDPKGLENIQKIEAKSAVHYPGILQKSVNKNSKKIGRVILWNHRWEYDKNPERFFDLIRELKRRKIEFKLAVLGEQFKSSPIIFELAKDEFKEEIIHWGFIEDSSQYHRILAQSKIIPITSNQDFFGISCVEAMSYGVIPVLPDRLAFPEHIPPDHRGTYLYNNFDELVEKTISFLNSSDNINQVEAFSKKYLWSNLIDMYDKFLLASTTQD